MTLSQMTYVVTDGVAVLTMNRPERLNAWTSTLERDLRQAIASAQNDDTVRCVVITGAGRAFCAGVDVGVMKEPTQTTTELTISDRDDEQRYGYLWHVDKPLIAAINGPVAGVGACLTLYCDLRFISSGAKLALPYSRRGLVAEHGTAWLLPRLIGPMHAADLLLSGRTLLADEVDRIGLANLLPAEGFFEAVMDRAKSIASSTSPRSIRIIKRQLSEARYQTLAQATRVADLELEACRQTEDFREGI